MRPLALTLCLTLVSAALLALPAVAQDQTCAVSLAEGDNPGTGGFDQGATRTFAFVVTNTGSLPAEGEVFISPPRPGWFWPQAKPNVQLDSGASQTIEIPVEFEGDRAGDAELEVQIQNVECTTPLGVGSQSGSNSDPVTLSLSHAPIPTTGDAGDDEGLSSAWWVFGAIVVGTAVAVPVVYSRRGPKLDVECEDAEGEVVAGRGTSFPVRLANKSKEPVHVNLEVAGVQEGWSALTTLPELELAGKESRTIYMMVRAPPAAKNGDLCVAKLAVTPEGGSTKTVKTLTRVGKPSGGKAPEDDA